jgi:N-acetylglutamate synthase
MDPLPPDLDVVFACEERLVNVWPAVSTMLMDGWVVRFAHGYSGRANAASPVVRGARLVPALLDHIERLYVEAGLRPTVRITPLADEAAGRLLAARGYRIKDQSWMMTMPLPAHRDLAPDPRVTLEAAPSRGWVAGVCSHQEPSKRNHDHLMAIVGQIRVPAAFATLRDEGAVAGFGMCAVDRGWAEIGSVIIDTARRGRGLGHATVDALLAWAARQGADHAFLQVDQTNMAAVSLYERLGFRTLCGYRTMIRP